jgi:hypothetical protein
MVEQVGENGGYNRCSHKMIRKIMGKPEGLSFRPAFWGTEFSDKPILWSWNKIQSSVVIGV